MRSYVRLLSSGLVVGVVWAASLATAGAQRPSADVRLPLAVEETVRGDLAAIAGTARDEVTFLRVAEVLWRDSCIGIYSLHPPCLPTPVPGWVIWAEADGHAARYHATIEGAGSAARRIDPATVHALPLPLGALDPGGTSDGRFFHGQQPESGNVGLLVTARATTPFELTTSLDVLGCRTGSLAVVLSGRWLIYVTDAPVSARHGFPSVLPGSTPFFVRCS